MGFEFCVFLVIGFILHRSFSNVDLASNAFSLCWLVTSWWENVVGFYGFSVVIWIYPFVPKMDGGWWAFQLDMRGSLRGHFEDYQSASTPRR